jgi:UDP-N-acetylglucosamine--dolichyl-phosphate N-acetylglucosaminephosphotransferase
MPQLTGYVPCPRHRLALYDSKNDKLLPVVTNMNMLNLSLRWLGPTNEGVLCLKLLLFQAVFSLVPLVHLFWFGGAN